jgi:phosphatidylinositol kinase/protein kinase (PI-3  family)
MNCNLIETKQNNISLKESLKNYLEKNQIPEEIKKILLEELK